MYIVRKFQPQIDRFISSGSRQAFLLAFALMAVVMAIFGACILKFGSPPMNGRPWDSPMLVDGAWRILNGQAPHRDFYNYLGDLPFYMTALGMKLSWPCMSAIDYGNVVLMIIVVIAAMGILRRRTNALLAFLYCLFMAVLVITPKPLGDPYDYTDHAMLYNRYGEAFIALFGLIVLLPPKPEFSRRWAQWAEAALAGVVLIVLLGCKLNYFAVGIGFLVVASITGRVRPAWVVVCACSAAAFLAIASAWSRIPLSAVVHDYRMMSACQTLAGRIRGFVIQSVKSILLLPVLLLFVWEDFTGQSEEVNRSRLPWQNILVIVSIFGAATLLLSSNCQLGEMPLLALAALCGVEMVARSASAAAPGSALFRARQLGITLIALLFFLPPIMADLKTIRFVTFANVKRDWNSPESLQTTSLKDFRFVRDGTRGAETETYLQELNEGTELLRRHLSPDMRLNAIMFSDPFHVALGLIPASGGIISLSIDGLTKASHPPLAQLLGNGTHLMTDRDPTPLQEAYGPEWDALHLEVVERTQHFSLFKVPRPAGDKP